MKSQALFINPDPVQMVPEELFDEGLLNQANAVIENGIATDEQWDECRRISDALKDQLKKVEAKRKLKVGPFNEVVKAINDWFRPYSTAISDAQDKLGKLYTNYYNDREAKRRAAEAEAARIKAEAEAAAAKARAEAEAKAEEARKQAEAAAKKINDDSLFGDEVEVRDAEQQPAGFTMKPVTSSNVEAIGYDAAGQRFAIQFKNHKRYVFKNVPSWVYSAMEKADSVGKAFNTMVRDKYDIEAIEVMRPAVAAPVPVAPAPTVPAPLKSAAPIRKVWKAEIINEKLVPREFCVSNMILIMDAHARGITEIPGVRFYQESTLVRSRR